jgi:hypothetical protein
MARLAVFELSPEKPQLVVSCRLDTFHTILQYRWLRGLTPQDGTSHPLRKRSASQTLHNRTADTSSRQSCKAEGRHVNEQVLRAMSPCMYAVQDTSPCPRQTPICHIAAIRNLGPRSCTGCPRTSLASRGWSHADLILSVRARWSRGGPPSRFRFPIVCANRCASANHGFLGEGAPICTSGSLAL